MVSRLMLGNSIRHPLGELRPCVQLEGARHVVQLSVVPHTERDGAAVVCPQREPDLVAVVVGLDDTAALGGFGRAARLSSNPCEVCSVFLSHDERVSQ